MIKVVILSDMHCGHVKGLTPPDYQIATPKGENLKHRKAVKKLQQAAWNFFATEIKALGNIHRVVVVGDCVDGDGRRGGAKELIAPDINVQTDMAIACLRFINAQEYSFVYGTPFHTGIAMDFEVRIAEAFGSSISATATYDTRPQGGCRIFHFKHKIGNSANPMTISPSLARAKVNNLLYSERGVEQRANTMVRAHIHRYVYCEGADWSYLVLPALTVSSEFGSRQCDNVVDFGFVHFEGDMEVCHPHIKTINPLTCQEIK